MASEKTLHFVRTVRSGCGSERVRSIVDAICGFSATPCFSLRNAGATCIRTPKFGQLGVWPLLFIIQLNTKSYEPGQTWRKRHSARKVRMSLMNDFGRHRNARTMSKWLRLPLIACVIGSPAVAAATMQVAVAPLPANAAEVAVDQPAVSQVTVQPAPGTVVPADATVQYAIGDGIPAALARAAEQAVETFPAIAAAQSAIRATSSELKAARWLRFPSAEVEIATLDDRIGRISPGIQVNQPLWTGGRISGTIDRAKATRQAALAQLEETVLDVLLRLSSSYFEIARTIQLESILKDSMSEHQRLVESMERRVAQEVSPRSDLDLARSRAAQVRQEMTTVSAQRYAALQRFYELVGDTNFELGPVPDYSESRHHPSADGAVVESLGCSPSLRRRKAEAEVALAEAKVAKASIYPQVGLRGSYTEIAGAQVGLSVRAQTSGGLSPFASAEAARSRAQTADLQISVAERETRETVVLDVVENTSARGRIEASSAAAEAAGAVTESFMRQFITGRRTWLDVMNAVRESNAARIGLTEAKTSAMSSATRLRLRTCRWAPQAG
ncbi:MAG: TolC family protein [Sphingomicrobium sp.]